MAAAAAVVSWWFTFHGAKNFIDNRNSNSKMSSESLVLSTAFAGGLSGAVSSGISLNLGKSPIWPESLQERSFTAKKYYQSTFIRHVGCHALFWTVYTGLREGVRSARIKSGRTDLKMDWQDQFNDFFAGFVSGLCFRGATLAYPPIPNIPPLTPGMVLITGLKMGTACLVFESADYYIRKAAKET